MDPWTAAKPRKVVRERSLLFETLVTYLWYGGVAGDGLRSVGVEALPPSKGACSILPTVRHLRAGALGHFTRPFDLFNGVFGGP